MVFSSFQVCQSLETLPRRSDSAGHGVILRQLRRPQCQTRPRQADAMKGGFADKVLGIWPPVHGMRYRQAGNNFTKQARPNKETMPTPSVKWTRSHTLAAFHLYTLLPFGKLHRGTSEVRQLAAWEGRTPSSVAMKLGNFSSLDPQIIASGRAGLSGATNQDRTLWAALQDNWDKVAEEAANAYAMLAVSHDVAADSALIEEPEFDIREGRTRSAWVQVRVNQARFRKSVLASYNATCCISGLQHEKLVIASHIVPWSMDNKNRLNPQNGLCLSALHDKAYDQGLITVMPDFTVRVSPKFKAHKEDSFMADALLRFNGQPIRLPERFRPAPEFLAFHARMFGFME
jgi:putative restriction endonuclease